MVLEQLGGQTDGVSGQYGPIGPHLQGQLVVVGNLTQTGSFYHVIHAPHRRVNRVDGDEANAQIGVEVLVGGDVAASALEAHLHVQLAAFGNRGDIDVFVQDFDVAVGFNHSRSDHAGLVGAQIERLRTLARQLEGNLLEVQDDVGGILDHAGDGLELVQYALDANRGDRGALDRTEQGAAQGVADGGAKAALKGLGAELAEDVGERLGIDCQALRFLKSSPKHIRLSFPARLDASRCILRRPRKFSFCWNEGLGTRD